MYYFDYEVTATHIIHTCGIVLQNWIMNLPQVTRAYQTPHPI